MAHSQPRVLSSIVLRIDPLPTGHPNKLQEVTLTLSDREERGLVLGVLDVLDVPDVPDVLDQLDGS
jgi:hypothetical protein